MANEVITENKATGFGNKLISWEVDEYEKHTRGPVWFTFATIAGVALIVYALFTQNFLFAVIILMFGVIYFLSGMRVPSRIEVAITDNGVMLGETFFPYRDMKTFAIVYEPPVIKNLYIDLKSRWRPLLSIPLENVNPVEVRDLLLPFAIENLEHTEESLTDLVSRLYKL
ncbi:hypothetical protein KJ910_03045 [Patescibacteria group bacterium]|nr:hypothetical protein [Patescibacteria group bacterium]MBU1907092.1 hypothetical protein [Patescibacteria group bacterium]